MVVSKEDLAAEIKQSSIISCDLTGREMTKYVKNNELDHQIVSPGDRQLNFLEFAIQTFKLMMLFIKYTCAAQIQGLGRTGVAVSGVALFADYVELNIILRDTKQEMIASWHPSEPLINHETGMTSAALKQQINSRNQHQEKMHLPHKASSKGENWLSQVPGTKRPSFSGGIEEVKEHPKDEEITTNRET
eukprot:jgi/Psemu1/11361/gm1.11361_g